MRGGRTGSAVTGFAGSCLSCHKGTSQGPHVNNSGTSGRKSRHAPPPGGVFFPRGGGRLLSGQASCENAAGQQGQERGPCHPRGPRRVDGAPLDRQAALAWSGRGRVRGVLSRCLQSGPLFSECPGRAGTGRSVCVPHGNSQALGRQGAKGRPQVWVGSLGPCRHPCVGLWGPGLGVWPGPGYSPPGRGTHRATAYCAVSCGPAGRGGLAEGPGQPLPAT